MQANDTCPECGRKAIPIANGMPGPGLFEAAERDEVILGGCCVMIGKPTRGCAPAHRWGFSDR